MEWPMQDDDQRARSTASQSDNVEHEARAKKWHIALFPEEYDFGYDSSSEAKERRRGVNPMSEAYITKTNRRRAELGFGPYAVDRGAPNDDTFTWVLEQLTSDNEAYLDGIKKHRDDEDQTCGD